MYYFSIMILSYLSKIHSFKKKCFFHFIKTMSFSWCQLGLACKGLVTGPFFIKWRLRKHCFKNDWTLVSLNIHVIFNPNQEEKLLGNKLEKFELWKTLFFQTGKWNVQNLLFRQDISTNYISLLQFCHTN